PYIPSRQGILALEILSESSKHGTVSHIMSVNDSIAVLKVTAVGILDKYGACGIRVSFKGMMKIVIIVCSLHHWIADLCSLNLYPCNNILVDCRQTLPVYLRRHRSIHCFTLQ